MDKIRELDEILKIDQVFDIAKKELSVYNHKVYLYYLTFLTDAAAIRTIMAKLIDLNLFESKPDISEIINTICNGQVSKYDNIYMAINELMTGQLLLIIPNVNYYLIIDVRNYPTRGITEPDSEKVIRGSKDGFTENIAVNVGLIRRRIRTNELITKCYMIGENSKTHVVLAYINNLANPQMIKSIENKLNSIKTDELIMSDKALVELINDQKLQIYPIVRYTERPDIFSIHLNQGMFGILVDTSPSAILAPITIFDHLEHVEEYRQTNIPGTYLRIIRYLGILVSFFAIPIWFSLVTYYNILPDSIKPLFNANYNYLEIFIQIIIIEIGIEMLKMASIHTPAALGTTLGIIAGLIISDVAITLGFFTETIMLLSAFSAIGSFITPSYELSVANKISKLFLILLIFFFNIWGLIIGTIVILLYLVFIKSFGNPYLSPLIPFNYQQFKKLFIRRKYKNKN